MIHRLFPEIENVMVGAVLLMLLWFVVYAYYNLPPTRDGFDDEVCKQLLARNEDEGRPRLLGS